MAVNTTAVLVPTVTPSLCRKKIAGPVPPTTEGETAELWFGAPEIFVPAKALVNGSTVTPATMSRVTYVHILLPRHHVVTANGVASESFFPARTAIKALHPVALTSLLATCPELVHDPASYGPTARPCLGVREARWLAQRVTASTARFGEVA